MSYVVRRTFTALGLIATVLASSGATSPKEVYSGYASLPEVPYLGSLESPLPLPIQNPSVPMPAEELVPVEVPVPQPEAVYETEETKVVSEEVSDPNKCAYEGLIRSIWPAHVADRAITIAMRESTCDPRAQNPSGASGLFQLMSPLHDDLIAGVCGDAALIWEPSCNIAAALALWNGSGWSPWAATDY